MSDCKHHFHLVKTERPRGSMGPTLKYYRCCHCNEFKMKRVEPVGPSVWEDDRSECGPFKPNVTPYWSDR